MGSVPGLADIGCFVPVMSVFRQGSKEIVSFICFFEIFFFRCNCSTASVRGAAAANSKAFCPIFPPTTAVAAPQAVSRDPFHFPPPQPCAPNPTAGRGEIHLAAGDGNVDRSGALRDIFASVAAAPPSSSSLGPSSWQQGQQQQQPPSASQLDFMFSTGAVSSSIRNTITGQSNQTLPPPAQHQNN